eukprot:1166406_1
MSTTSTNSELSINKRKRKPRKVKNAYIDISKVSEDRGTHYHKWIAIAQQKLKEREYKLLEVRTDIIMRIVQEQTKSTNKNESIIPSTFFELCLFELYTLIDSWQGVKLSKLSSNSGCTDSFKNYFMVAKNWWDQKKKQKYGQLFWCGVFDFIQQYYDKTQCNATTQRRFVYGTLRKLLDGSVQYANTKQQPLIPIGTIKNCKHIKQYLLNLHETLDVNQWIQDDICQSMDHKKIRTGNAKNIMIQLQNQLDVLIAGSDANHENHSVSCAWNVMTVDANVPQQQQLFDLSSVTQMPPQVPCDADTYVKYNTSPNINAMNLIRSYQTIMPLTIPPTLPVPNHQDIRVLPPAFSPLVPILTSNGNILLNQSIIPPNVLNYTPNVVNPPMLYLPIHFQPSH